MITNHSQIKFNNTEGYTSDIKFRNIQGIPIYSLPCILLETLFNPSLKDIEGILNLNETMMECWKSFKYHNYDQCISTIDDFIT